MVDYTKIRTAMRTVAATTSVVLAMGAGSVFASVNVDVDGAIDTTGPSSVNENTWDVDNDVDVDAEYDGEVENEVEVDADSGDFDVEMNTTVGDIAGGDIEINGEFENTVNDGDSGLDLSGVASLDVTGDFSMDTTGPNSENLNDLDVDNDVDVDVEYDAEIENEFDLDLDSGDFDVNNNTTVGDIRGGDIEANLTVENHANQGAGLDLGDLGSTDVNVDASIDTSGPNSVNENTVDVDNDVDVDVEYDAEIENEVEVDTDSGDFDVNNNTTVGDIESGSQRINLNFVNHAN